MTTQDLDTRRDPRVILAQIALATGLPIPKRIYFYDDPSILGLDLATLADGIAWSQHLGGDTTTYVNSNDGRCYLYGGGGSITWHGWTVQLHASDPPATTKPLVEDITARLSDLVSA